jgi:hypothetical protein
LGLRDVGLEPQRIQHGLLLVWRTGHFDFDIDQRSVRPSNVFYELLYEWGENRAG